MESQEKMEVCPMRERKGVGGGSSEGLKITGR